MTEAQYYIRICMILTANVTCILLSFRRGRRENARMILCCIGILILSQIYRVLTGDPLGLLNFMPGFWFLPSLYFIHKGSVAQKVFVTFTVLAMCHLILITTSFLAIGSITLRIVFLGAALAVYIALMAWRGHIFTQRVFDSATGSWWGYAAYISGFYRKRPDGFCKVKWYDTADDFAADVRIGWEKAPGAVVDDGGEVQQDFAALMIL